MYGNPFATDPGDEEARLRKKFRGRLPHEVLGPINADTRMDRWQDTVRMDVLRLTDPGFKLRSGAEVEFREIALSVARAVQQNDVVASWFINVGLWDL